MMALNEYIIRQITASPTFHRLLNQVREYEDIPNLALSRPSRLAIITALHQNLGVPILLVTDRADHALTLFEELALWAPGAERLLFPEPTPLFYENAPWSETTRRERLSVLTLLAAYYIPGAKSGLSVNELRQREETLEAGTLSRAEERRQYWEEFRGGPRDGEIIPIIVATARALMARTIPRRDFVKNTRNIKTGQVIQPNALAANWVNVGYEHVDTVVASGQFARRGGLVDVWPPAENQPVRIDFFGDEIETLRHFDPASQRTTKTIERALITPAREFILPTVGPNGPEDGEITYTEFDLPRLHAPASLVDFLPDQALILIDDLDSIEGISHDVETQALDLRDQYVADGLLADDFPQPYLSWSEVFDTITFKRYLQLGPASALEKSDLARMFAPNPRFGGRIKALMDHLAHQSNRGDQTIIVSRQSSRLWELWREYPAPPQAPPGPIFTQGTLAEGFLLSPPGEKRIHLISDGEIFGWRRTQPRRRPQPVSESPEAVYADLHVGDWVVHVDHGIGRFMGLVHRRMEGLEREYLSVEYDDGDQLFVPVHQADRLSRYVGPDGRTPSPTKLGTAQWKKTREGVEEAVEKVAQDLLDLYSIRQIVHGHAFGADSEWQRELEASFPYEETEDQKQVIAEVKRDMETPRPMDRLICGDVGYGKTEVALRAAFKAVFDGKQVAMLVPTTVLAQQHYHTFLDRLTPFPVTVEMLSRFRTEKEQQDIIKRLGRGEIDIVIGTHRLLSRDVYLKDLGLLIIDEEQRFGVSHKETLKKMRTEVDVLTMTATPIPRTLYMALTGVRDISTINTPPEERLPIVTHVGPYSQKLVRQAILRELERGGQVFFVHNRVQTIHGMRYHLSELVPEARVAVAHGQMPEKALSERMQDFTAGETDVLLTTTIIESGLDIPNANTLIVDRADTFGLAQLYQLRGRVGRGPYQAYAYFFKHRKKAPTLEGRQRLETLSEHTQLGAGFSIAMRDLEIRGAGDLLGTRQHGHIAAVGFHLYTRLLAQAVQRQSGHPAKPDQDLPLADLASVYSLRPTVNVDLPIPATIPPDYIADRDSRLRLYRRISDLRELPDVEVLASEFQDRFGPPPEEVLDLLFQIKIKLLAERAGLAAVYPENKQIVLRYPSLHEDSPPRLVPYLGPDIRVSKETIRILGAFENPGWRERLGTILETLGEHAV